MLGVERSFFSFRWPRGDDAVPALPLGNHDNQNATGIRLAEIYSARLAVSEHRWSIKRIVLNHLFRLFRGYAVPGYVVNVCWVPIKLH
jgi:hypothetical protein